MFCKPLQNDINFLNNSSWAISDKDGSMDVGKMCERPRKMKDSQKPSLNILHLHLSKPAIEATFSVFIDQ